MLADPGGKGATGDSHDPQKDARLHHHPVDTSRRSGSTGSTSIVAPNPVALVSLVSRAAATVLALGWIGFGSQGIMDNTPDEVAA